MVRPANPLETQSKNRSTEVYEMNLFKKSTNIVLGLTVALALSLASYANAAETGKVTGKVLDKDGKGVAGANVALRTPPEKGEGKGGKAPAAAAPGDEKPKGDRQKPVAKTKSEADGSFTLADVPAGDYMLVAQVKGVGNAREKVTVKAGETAEVKLTLKEGKPGGKKKAE
jgi:hypothetical protein